MKVVPQSNQEKKKTTPPTTSVDKDLLSNPAAAAIATDDDEYDEEHDVETRRTTNIWPRSSITVTMGLAYNTYLNSNKIYGCKGCKAHLANHEDIISRNFRGQHGKAYLFSFVVNVETGEPSERNMTTGRHIVRDIVCRQCKETVGWKYDKAFEPSEKYKEGKFILEAELLCNVS